MAKDFPPPLMPADRKRYLAVAFGAPDDNQTVDAIPDKFERQRCQARIAFEKERRRLDRSATYQYYGAPTGRFEDIADATAQAEAKAFVVDGFKDVNDFARVALRYPALVRNDPRLKEKLLNPWFRNDELESMP